MFWQIDLQKLDFSQSTNVNQICFLQEIYFSKVYYNLSVTYIGTVYNNVFSVTLSNNPKILISLDIEKPNDL